mmetsp:Transcript_51935/g.123640  ORF Transcript_51935/g.123640 Transcript_51935/m.123640 type:complete len:304 (-) Transcript_51935:303-1214(-)
MKSSKAMKTYIQRVVQASGGRVVREGDLSGLAPYYSGEKGVQSYTRLVEELGQKANEPNPFIVFGSPVAAALPVAAAVPVAVARPMPLSGSSATLDEAGYQAVATARNTQEMKVFIRHVVESMHGEVINEGGLSGFAPYYSGERATQSFARLTQELKEKAAERNPWLRLRPGHKPPPAAAAAASAAGGGSSGWSSGAMAGAGLAGMLAGALAGVAVDEAIHHKDHRDHHRGGHHHHQGHNHHNHHNHHHGHHWHHGRRWDPNVWCDDFTAEERKEWLVREKGYSQEAARQQVMHEFRHRFPEH